jgi:hypothetical protein
MVVLEDIDIVESEPEEGMLISMVAAVGGTDKDTVSQEMRRL